MIKLTYLIKKRPDLTEEEFLHYWRRMYAPVVRTHAHMLQLSRFVMSKHLDTVCNMCVAKSREKEVTGYDGIAEFWWDSIESYQEGAGSASGITAMEELVSVERKFIDLEASQLFFNEEIEMFDVIRPRRSPKKPARSHHSKVRLSNETTKTPLINRMEVR